MTFASLAQSSTPRFSWALLSAFVKRPLVILALSLGLLASALPLTSEQAIASAAPETAALEEGVYLYGESPQPQQVGATYMVMTVQAGQAVGAFYMPSSSFDCFYGPVTANSLDLTIVNSYDQVAYPYEVALAINGAVAATGAVPAVVPEGFHAIDTLSETDQQILATCQANFPF
ncbi:MAG: hypothetical protein ACFB0C_03995 [Leptolyngbyaceae cyanobacterium]